MAHFVIGHNLFFVRRQNSVFALIARYDNVHGLREVTLCDNASIALDGAQRCFVNQVGKLCAGTAGRGLRQRLVVDVICHHHLFGVHF